MFQPLPYSLQIALHPIGLPLLQTREESFLSPYSLPWLFSWPPYLIVEAHLHGELNFVGYDTSTGEYRVDDEGRGRGHSGGEGQREGEGAF